MNRETSLPIDAATSGSIGVARALLAVAAVVVPLFGVVSSSVNSPQGSAWPARFVIAGLCVGSLAVSYQRPNLAQHLRYAVWVIFGLLYTLFFSRAVAVEMPPTHVIPLMIIYMMPLLLLEHAWQHGLLTIVVMVISAVGYGHMAAPVVPQLTYVFCLLTIGLGASVATLARVRAEDQLRQSQVRLEARVEERTAQLRAEVAERRAAEADALRASRAKSTFLANMSHELRTPLNAITGYTELVQDELRDDGRSELVQDLDRVRQSASHLLRMVSDVLDLSRIEAGELAVVVELVDLSDKVAELIRLVEPERARSGCVLEVQVERGLHVQTDPARLAQIAINLLTNALKFTKDGAVRLEASLDGEQLVLAVHDTGAGIATDDIDRVFQTFVQLDASSTRRNDGSGLGLALSKDLAHRLGGTLTARSKLGAGSTFTLRLPNAFCEDAAHQ